MFNTSSSMFRFCPCVFFFLLCTVPAIWFLELNELEARMRLKGLYNITDDPAARGLNNTNGLSASIAGIGVSSHLIIHSMD